MPTPGIHRRALWIVGLLMFGSAGCAATPYRFSRFRAADEEPQPVVIEYGEPNKTLDRLGWFFGLPGRILPFDSKVNSHDISPETTQKLVAYLEKNDLTDVYVAVNQYDPKGQWRRLRENERIAPGWKYSTGLFSLLGYTLLPGRVFGGDSYNPFTNSLYVNSDVPAVVLCEAAYAKDVHSRGLPGAYATVNELPFVSLWRHTLAVSDVLGYARVEDDWEVEEQAYHVVYPQIGAHTAMAADPFVPLLVSPALGIGGAVVGHTAGRTIAARRTKERESAEARPEADPAEDEIRLTGATEQEPDRLR